MPPTPIPRRWRVTVCYIRDARDDVFGIDSRAAALGVDYIEIPERHSFDVSIFPALRRLVREQRIDIVHAHDYKTNLLVWLLHRLDGTTVLSTAHGWTGHSGARAAAATIPVDKWLLARLPFVVAVSSQIRDELIARGAAPGEHRGRPQRHRPSGVPPRSRARGRRRARRSASSPARS